MAITTTDILHIAELARLQLPPHDVQRYTTQVGQVLGYFAHLNQVDTTGVEPTSHAIATIGFARADEVQQTVLPEQILENAPARDGNLYKVPKVL